MRLLIHDYAGHPFQVQLSRTLAARGHQVTHVYASMIETPRGALAWRDDDPRSLDIVALGISGAFRKHSFFRRRFQEVEYGRKLADLIEHVGPDAVISGNTPTEPQLMAVRRCRRLGIRFVSWVQDFYGVAVDRLLRKRLPLAGAAIGAHYMRLDRRVLQQSDHVVLITEDFKTLTDSLGLDPGNVSVVENWAPLDELPVRPRANAWAEEHGLADKFCFLYSGTLGMKHDPALLADLAASIRTMPDARVVVVSEGAGATWLAERKSVARLDNLVLLPFQPFARMPDVLGTGDVLLAILEPDAGVFSVPSKVLSYLCAGRALLAAIPRNNLAAGIIARSGAGTVVEPGDSAAFMAAAERLRTDADARAQAGERARAYAERTFDVERVADRFERIVAGNARRSVRATSAAVADSAPANVTYAARRSG